MKTHDGNKDRPMSIKEAAAYMGVHPDTLRKWQVSGVLMPSYVTLGGHRRYTMADLVKVKAQSPDTLLQAWAAFMAAYKPA